MSAKPWFPFFPTDWRADSALRLCSPGARLLWLEMLCVMHEAEPRGHMLVNGKRMTNAQTARLVGIETAECCEWTAELEEAGVFSRTDDGVIFSRKMVRDSKKSEDQRDRVSKRWAGNEDRNTVGSTVGNTETDTGCLPHIHIPKPKERDKSLSTRGKDFETFWAAYPKKVGKPAALKAFPSALMKTSVAAMVAAIVTQKQSRKWREGFIPDPVKWLKNDGWDDQLDGAPPSPDDPLPPGAARSPSGTIYYPNAAW